MSHRIEVLAGSIDLDNEKIPSTAPFQVLLPGITGEMRDRVWEGRLLIPEGFVPEPVQRLLVVVPEDDFDENRLSQHLWNLASPRALGISLVGLFSLPVTEALQRRRLATIAGNTRNRNVTVQTKFVPGSNWIRAIEDSLRPGDLVVCLKDHKFTNWGVIKRPLGPVLASSLNVPVYIILDISIDPTSPVSSWVREAVVWLVAIGIMGAFAWMQLMIDRAYQGWQSILLTMITIVFEVLMLWKLSEMTS